MARGARKATQVEEFTGAKKRAKAISLQGDGSQSLPETDTSGAGSFLAPAGATPANQARAKRSRTVTQGDHPIAANGASGTPGRDSGHGSPGADMNHDPNAIDPNKALVVPLPTSPAWLANEAVAAPRILAQAEAFLVQDAASMKSADDAAKFCLQLRDKLENERTSVTGPLLEAKRRVDGWFKPVTNILEQAARVLKGKESHFLLAEERRQQERYAEAARAHELAVAGVPGAHQQMALALQATSTAVVEAPRGTSVREEWRAEIFNPGMVPCFYHCVDEARIQAVVRATPSHVEPAPIAGVRFVRVPIVSMRR